MKTKVRFFSIDTEITISYTIKSALYLNKGDSVYLRNMLYIVENKYYEADLNIWDINITKNE